MAQSDPNTIKSTRTGGFSLLKLMFICVGIALICIQGLMVYATGFEKVWDAGHLGPVTMGLFFLVYAFFFLGKSGHASIEGGILKGKMGKGKSFEFPVVDLGSVDLASKGLLVKDKAGKILLRTPNCSNPKFAGLLWLQLAYPGLPTSFWATLKADSPLPQALRFFLDPDARTSFFDAGVVIEIEGKPYFMPTHDTLRTTREVRGDQSLSALVQQAAPVLKFEPEPSLLPSAAFLTALSAAQISDAKDIALEYIDEHGGCALIAAEDGGYTGETGSWPVRVEMHGISA